MLTSPTPAIRRSFLHDWGAAGLVAFLCAVLAGVVVPHATRSVSGASTLVVLLGMAGALAWYARPRQPDAKRLARALETLSAGGQVVIQLTSLSASAIGRAGIAYAAVARSGATEVVLAQAAEPATVLAVARYWQTRLAAPLLPGWGLGKHQLEALDAERPVPVARINYTGPGQHGAVGTTWSLSCAAVALLALAGSVALFREHPAALISLVLLGIGVSLLVLFALASRTDETRIVIGETLEIERYCLRFKLGGIRLPVAEVRLLAIVSPAGRHGRHLLLGSSAGFWAIECPAAIEPVVRGPVRALRPPQSSTPSSSTAPLQGGAPLQLEEPAPRIVSGSRQH